MAGLLSRLKRGNRADEQPTWLAAHREQLVRTLNGILLLLAILAILSLAAEFGFYLSAELEQIARFVNLMVLYGFTCIALLKLLFAERPVLYARSRWLELSLVLLILIHLLFPKQVEVLLYSLNPLLTPDAIARIYLAITQLFVLIAFIPATLRYSRRIMAGNIQPSLLIVLSFLFFIACGTIVLLFPRATVSQSLSLVDALFTSTSAVCVTGLLVVDTATYFTPFGHSVLMILMQIGGLGIMTLTTFFAYVMGGGGKLREYSTMQSLLGEESLGTIKRMVIQIALVTFAFEAAGAGLLYYFTEGAAVGTNEGRTFFVIFHSISAFCNAGFTLTTENFAHTLLRFNSGVLWTSMLLIIIGGLGFPVLMNLGSFFSWNRRDQSQRRLSVHTKLVLLMTFLLLLGGSLTIYLLENSGSLRDLSLGQQWLTSLFHSVSARTAGFNTLDIGAFSAPALFLLMLLMWIGASPGSTGGGVKTTTVALAVLNIHAIVSGRNRVEVFRKRVSDIAITKAFSTVLLSLFVVVIAVFILLTTEHSAFEQLLFEVVSALSTVGLSTGITPHLSPAGKLVITTCMIVGRVGLLAFVIALTRQRSEGRYTFTEENVLVT